jgi:hypothetical protein
MNKMFNIIAFVLKIFYTAIFFIMLIFVSKSVIVEFEIIPIFYRYLIAFILHVIFFMHVLNVIIFFFYKGGVESKIIPCYKKVLQSGMVCVLALAFFVLVLKLSIDEFLKNGSWVEILEILPILPFFSIPFFIFYYEYKRCKSLQSEAIISLSGGDQ